MRSAPRDRKGFLFSLPEYDSAFRERFQAAIDALAGEKAPILRDIPTQRMEHVPATHVTAASGQVVSNAPYAIALPFKFSGRDVIDFDLTAFAATCDAAADVYTDETLDQLLNYTVRITDAFETATDAQGEPFGWPVILKGLSKVEIEFNDQGEPILPSLVSARDKRKIVPYPSMSGDDRQAFDELMAQKREEFNARRRTRQLR